MINVEHMFSLIFMLISTKGYFAITIDPVKCIRNGRCELNCNIGEITNTVKWLNQGISYFNCSSPYSAGICSMISGKFGIGSIDVNVTSGSTTAVIFMGSYNVGVWTCIHGHEIATLDVTIVDPANVTSFQTSVSGSQGNELRLECTVISTIPVHINITAIDRKQNRIILYQVKESSLRAIRINVKAGGKYEVFRCEVWNGYGSVHTRTHNASSTYRATIKDFRTPSTGSEGDLLNLNCKVTSKLRIDVNITVTGQKEKIILTQRKKSSVRSVTATVKVGCGYHLFSCEVWNGYGTVNTATSGRWYSCPVNILYDQTNTTVDAVAGAQHISLRLYFSGYPGYPKATWYRRDGNREIKLTSFRIAQSLHHSGLTDLATAYLTIIHVRIQDAGQYSVHANISGRIDIVVFKLNVKMPQIQTQTSGVIPTDLIYATTTVNPASHDSTQVVSVTKISTQPGEQPLSSTTGIGIGVGIGVIGTMILVGILHGVIWLKTRYKQTTYLNKYNIPDASTKKHKV